MNRMCITVLALVLFAATGGAWSQSAPYPPRPSGAGGAQGMGGPGGPPPIDFAALGIAPDLAARVRTIMESGRERVRAARAATRGELAQILTPEQLSRLEAALPPPPPRPDDRPDRPGRR